MPLKKSRKRDLEEDEDNHESEEELTTKPKSKKSKKASADVELGEREQDDKGDPFWTVLLLNLFLELPRLIAAIAFFG